MDINIILIILLNIKTALLLTAVRNCRPRYHFWRPYFGDIPDDAWKASDRNRNIFIGKIIPLDDNSWTHAGQIEARKFPDWGWPEKQVLTVTQFVEILCSESHFRGELQWKTVYDKTDMKIAETLCCLVESGVTKRNDRNYYAYVGRKFENGSFLIGPVYLMEDWTFKSGLYATSSGLSYYFPNDFEILTYGCFSD